MNKNLKTLSNHSFLWALCLYAFTYVTFHFITPEGSFTTMWQAQCGKPFIALLFGLWGTMFLFAGVISRMVAHIIFPAGEGRKE